MSAIKAAVVVRAGHMLAAVPEAGTLPPGTAKLALITAWTTGLVGLALFVGFLVAMGKTGLEALRHGQFEGGKGAIACLVGAVFLGAATPIFAAMGVTTV